jgi:hypothetical protein
MAKIAFDDMKLTKKTENDLNNIRGLKTDRDNKKKKDFLEQTKKRTLDFGKFLRIINRESDSY